MYILCVLKKISECVVIKISLCLIRNRRAWCSFIYLYFILLLWYENIFFALRALYIFNKSVSLLRFCCVCAQLVVISLESVILDLKYCRLYRAGLIHIYHQCHKCFVLECVIFREKAHKGTAEWKINVDCYILSACVKTIAFWNNTRICDGKLLLHLNYVKLQHKWARKKTYEPLNSSQEKKRAHRIHLAFIEKNNGF